MATNRPNGNGMPPLSRARTGQRPEPTTFDGKLADRLFRINVERIIAGRRNLTIDEVKRYVGDKGVNNEDEKIFDHLLTADVPQIK